MNAKAGSSTDGRADQPASIAADDARDESSDLDLISTIESDLTLVVQIMSSTLHHIANRSAHVQLNSTIPPYNPVGTGQLMASKSLVDEATMRDNIEELTDDLVGKVKDIERMVCKLPKEESEEDFVKDMERLQAQIPQVNAEYAQAVSEAASLQEEIDAVLSGLCKDYQKTREKLSTATSSFQADKR